MRALPPAAADALGQLLEGNARYVRGEARHPHQSSRWRHEVAGGQHPGAAVLGCADSRVPPEILFDQGVGDLFVVRTAGHVTDAAVVSSLEFAVARLEVPLVLVLGHDRCGAVQATVDTLIAHAEPAGDIAALVAPIAPAARSALGAGDPVATAVRANVRHVVEELRTHDAVLAPRVAAGRIAVVGATYDLDTGRVDVLAG